MMQAFIAGIKTTEPGFRKFKVKPQMCGLKKIETGVPTPYGTIEIKIEKDVLSLLVPDNTTAEVEWKGQTMSLDSGLHKI